MIHMIMDIYNYILNTQLTLFYLNVKYIFNNNLNIYFKIIKF